MKLRDMLNGVREWLRGSRRRQASAIVVGLGVLALPVYLVAFSGGDDGGEEVRSMPSPSPVAQTSEPTRSATATPGAGETPQVIGGVQVEPLKFGGEVELPDDVALIVETGCTGCDGPTRGLIRVYRDAAGEVRTDPLFEVDLLGLPPRLVQSDEVTREVPPYITGFALHADASEIVVAVCSRGGCGPLGGPSPDAETALFRSLDGGVTWVEIGRFDGARYPAAIASEGVVLTRWQGESGPEYQLLPGDDPVRPPADAGGRPPLSLPDGELVWPTDDGRLLHSDGTELLALGKDAVLRLMPGIRLDPTGERFAVTWGAGSRRRPFDSYLGVAELGGGGLISAYGLDGYASVGGWAGWNLAVGNAPFSPEELDAVLPNPYEGEIPREALIGFGGWPAVFDLGSGKKHPIVHPFLDSPGRNGVVAVSQGRFARVVGTGSCLNIRSAALQVLDCAADGVLLRDMGATGEISGETYRQVVTPGGIAGWASTAYLELKPIPAHPDGPFARVVAPGGCLNIRAEPGRTGKVLDCETDGELLLVTQETRDVGGETWLRVRRKPRDGWASTTYLELNATPPHPKGGSVIVNPAAHEAFLAWFEEYATEHGLSTDIVPVGFQEGGACWAVHDSSPSEYLYGLGHCPGEGITRVRVSLQDGAWRAEQAHFQLSVGKPSWEEIAERELQGRTPGFEVRIILEREDAVVVALVRPEEVAGEFLNTSRFTKGEDGLWRGYLTYNALDGLYGTPEDALVADALRSFPDLPVLGDCGQAQLATDTGKVCWALQSDTGDARTYVIGPTFSEGELVELVRVELDLGAGASGWQGIPYDRFHPY